MALSIIQTPATASLAQSPIIFSLQENSTAIVTQPAFQYVCDLYYWQGSPSSRPAQPDYTLVKYPNVTLCGIFDLNRILNSTLTDLAQVNQSNVMYYSAELYWEYPSGSTYVSSSKIETDVYKALDGYGIFQEEIGLPIYDTTPFWPLMTDGPSVQSAFIENYGSGSVYVGTTGGGTQPTAIRYVSNLGTTVDFTVSGNTSSDGQIRQYPIGPSESNFPLSTIGLEWFTTQPISGSTLLGQPIKYEITCQQKYPNVRVKWKNRFGQFDWFNFDMVSRQSFSTERRTYQPQLGSWQARTLSYNNYDSSTLNYIADSKQGLSVNSNWVNQDYNELFKQLLVTDEAYWVYDEANNDLRPITIATESIVFKTGVNDKVIQYAFDFNWGQSYKLII